MYEDKKVRISEGRSETMELQTVGMDPSEFYCDVLPLPKR